MGSLFSKLVWWKYPSELENDILKAEQITDSRQLYELWAKYTTKENKTDKDKEFLKYLEDRFMSINIKDKK